MCEKRQTPKDRMKEAWSKGDLVGLLGAGMDNFLDVISNRPISYQTFLRYTGQFLDKFIVDTCKQEHLAYIGGRLTLTIKDELPHVIQLCADFYFQNVDKQWILKKKEGQVDSNRLSDYDTAPELATLKEEKKLEYPIDTPEVRG